MKFRLGFLLTLVLIAAAPQLASAQQKDTTSITHGTGKAGADNDDLGGIPPTTAQMRPEEQMGTSGFFLGMVSVLAGATFGSQYGQSHCPPTKEDRDCVQRHGYTGAVMASTLFVPVGVHLVNPKPKNILKSLAVSTVVGSAMYFGSKAIDGEPIALGAFLAIPLQVYTAVKIEEGKWWK